MQYAQNILETIGNTPMVKINHITNQLPCLTLAKVETFNPGNSVKDRMAVKMVEEAEKKGLLKPGGTIIEGTSGNTGMGLALAAIVKGYKLICVLNDKQSKEKMDILRAVGAEVVVCPTHVAPENPNSYYSVSKRLAEETPNSWYVNQYDNLANTQAHYENTGPEIWEQTDGKITHFVVGVGTGGTISGVGKYLKEKNPNIKIWGVDTYGSVFKKYHETGIFDENEIFSYVTEGIGEDILPANVDFSVIDGFTKVSDRDAAIFTRKLAIEEGIFCGNSAGSAIKGVLQLKDEFKPDDVVVVLFHDSGTRYVGKIYNDDWMNKMGYFQSEPKTVSEFIQRIGEKEVAQVRTEELVQTALMRMRQYNLAAIPVFDSQKMVGSITNQSLIKAYFQNPDLANEPVKNLMDAPLLVLSEKENIVELKAALRNHPYILVETAHKKLQLVTQTDIINYLA